MALFAFAGPNFEDLLQSRNLLSQHRFSPLRQFATFPVTAWL